MTSAAVRRGPAVPGGRAGGAHLDRWEVRPGRDGRFAGRSTKARPKDGPGPGPRSRPTRPTGAQDHAARPDRHSRQVRQRITAPTRMFSSFGARGDGAGRAERGGASCRRAPGGARARCRRRSRATAAGSVDRVRIYMCDVGHILPLVTLRCLVTEGDYGRHRNELAKGGEWPWSPAPYSASPASMRPQYRPRFRRGHAHVHRRHGVASPGRNQFSGGHRGAAAIGEMFGGMMTVTEGTFALRTTGSPMANGALVATPVHISATRNGGRWE